MFLKWIQPHTCLNLAPFLLLIATTALAETPQPTPPTGDPAALWTENNVAAFKYENRNGFLVLPGTAAKGNPWLWSAHPPVPDAITRGLLDKGFHLAWVDTDSLYGNTEAMTCWEAYYAWAVKERGLSDKPVLTAKGEHALPMFIWAAHHLNQVGCLYAEDPWLCLRHTPESLYRQICAAHGLKTDTEAEAFAGSPVNLASSLGGAAIPLLLRHAGLETSSAERKEADQFYKAYRLAGKGSFETVITPEDKSLLENGLALHALYFILRNTGCLPAAQAEKSLPDLPGWSVADFIGSAGVWVLDGVMLLETGNDMTGVRWNGDIPKEDYEITLDAMRLSGNDFFCGLTAPWGESAFSLIVGGWGGTCIGISSLDYLDAYNNETARFRSLVSHRWYPVKLRVTGGRIQAWVDNEALVDTEVGDRDVDIRWEMAPTKPLGIATWRTTGAIRNFKINRTPTP